MGSKPISKGSKTPKPFDGAETLDQDKENKRLKTICDQIRRQFGVDPSIYLESLQEAVELVKAGASPATAIEGCTGLSISVWRNISPGMMDVFESIHKKTATGAECKVLVDKPDVWLRQNFPDKWTPNQKIDWRTVPDDTIVKLLEQDANLAPVPESKEGA